MKHKSKWKDLFCRWFGHTPGEITFWIDRGPTWEGIDSYGCTRCGKTSLEKK